jgi:4-amino-4-deoxy-L-arabinose transferase-like glycosyltransferase
MTMRGPVIVALVGAVALWGFGVGGDYGWFTDELYFLACAKRPALGYIDQPPLAPLMLAAVRALTGDRLWLIRIVPVAFYAASVLLGARLARQLGGGNFAQLLSAILIATAPAIMVIAGFFSMNPLDVLIAMALVSIVIELIERDEPRRWLVYGALVGIGVLNKHTVVVPAALFAAAALASPARRHFATRWPYLGAALALAIALPNLVWLAQHDWITFDFYAESTAAKNIETSALGTLVGQVLFIGPLGFACSVAGAVWLVRKPHLRGLAIVWFVGVIAMVFAAVSRPDRILSLYPIVLAAGAVLIERVTARRRYLRIIGLVFYAATSAASLPLLVPVLPPAKLASFAKELGMTPQLEKQKAGSMPQWMADRLGWHDVAEQTAAVVHALPATDRVVLLGENYGIAGALERFGPQYGLSAPVISTHNSYWLWAHATLATIDHTTAVVAVTDSESLVRHLFVDVRQAGTVHSPFSFEDGTPIWIARTPRVPLAVAWSTVRHMQ